MGEYTRQAADLHAGRKPRFSAIPFGSHGQSPWVEKVLTRAPHRADGALGF